MISVMTSSVLTLVCVFALHATSVVSAALIGGPISDHLRSQLPSSIKICITDAVAPMQFYNPVSGAITGYEVDLVTLIAENLNLTYTKVYGNGYEHVLEHVGLNLSDPDVCHVGVAAFPLVQDTVLSGISYTRATYRSGMAVLVKVYGGQVHTFSFITVFSWQIWALLFGSGLFVATVVWMSERDYVVRGLGKARFSTQFRKGMGESIFKVAAKAIQCAQDIGAVSLSSRLVALAWGMLVLVLTSTYTAALTTRMGNVQPLTTISSVDDLRGGGYKVMTWSYYASMFGPGNQFGLTPLLASWDDDAQGRDMVQAVRNGSVDALILDEPFLRYTSLMACDVQVVGSLFLPSDYVMGINPNLDPEFLEVWNEAMILLSTTGIYDNLDRAWFPPSTACNGYFQSNVVQLDSVLGLWYILAGVVCFSMIILLLPRISKRFELDQKNTFTAQDRASSMTSGQSFSARLVTQVSLARTSVLRQLNWLGKQNASNDNANTFDCDSNLDINDRKTNTDKGFVLGKPNFDKSRTSSGFSSSSKVAPITIRADGSMILGKDFASMVAATSLPACGSPRMASSLSQLAAVDPNLLTPRARQYHLTAGSCGSIPAWPSVHVQSGVATIVAGKVAEGGWGVRAEEVRPRSPRTEAAMPREQDTEMQIEDSDPDDM